MAIIVLIVIYLCQRINIKGARAQKIRLKVLFLKYDLGKTLSKEMWCKMADTKKDFD